MPRKSGDPLQGVDIGAGEGHAMVRSFQTAYGMAGEATEIVNAAYASSNRPLLSGHTVCIQHDTEEEAKSMKLMIDLQWACVVIAAMSGAADPVNLPEDDDDDDDDNDDDGGDLAFRADGGDLAFRVQSIPEWLQQLDNDTDDGADDDSDVVK
jgi:hypothetical protein